MATPTVKLLAMSDEELMERALSGDAYSQKIAATAFALRLAQRVATDARATLTATRKIAWYTLLVAGATSLVAVATLVAAILSHH